MKSSIQYTVLTPKPDHASKNVAINEGMCVISGHCVEKLKIHD